MLKSVKIILISFVSTGFGAFWNKPF